MSAAGRIPFKINGIIAPAVRNIDVQVATPQKVTKHSDQKKRRAEGQEDVKWTLTCTMLKDKQEILDIIEDAESRGEVTFTYQIGSREYLLTDVGVETEGVNSDSDGTADLNLAGVAVDRTRVK